MRLAPAISGLFAVAGLAMLLFHVSPKQRYYKKAMQFFDSANEAYWFSRSDRISAEQRDSAIIVWRHFSDSFLYNSEKYNR